MRNYAEELAYYYFRFNGFFLLNNYVTHPGDRAITQNKPNPKDKKVAFIRSHSDSDLLAVRIGQPEEKVGIDFNSTTLGIAPCTELIKIISDCLKNRELQKPEIIGIICEVKAGEDIDVNSDNLKAQLMRFGFIGEQNLQAAINQITANGYYLDNQMKHVVIRILVSVRARQLKGFIPLSITQTLGYISLRFRELRVGKEGGWDKFDSSLIQFLIKEPLLRPE